MASSQVVRREVFGPVSELSLSTAYNSNEKKNKKNK